MTINKPIIENRTPQIPINTQGKSLLEGRPIVPGVLYRGDDVEEQARRSYPEFTSSLIRFLDLNYGAQIYEPQNIFDKKQLKGLNDLNSFISTYDLEPGYNYYTDFYEQTVKTNQLAREPSLPNLYIVSDYINNKSLKYQDIISVGGSITIKPKTDNNSNSYFDEFGKLYNKMDQLVLVNPTASAPTITVNQKLGVIGMNQSRIYFTGECVRNFNDINKNEFLFPYNIKCTFDTHKQSNLGNLALKSGLLDFFNKTIISKIPSYTQKTLMFNNEKIITNISGSSQIVKNLESEQVLAYEFANEDAVMMALKDSIKNISSLRSIFTLGEVTPQDAGPFGTITTNSTSNALQNFIKLQMFSNRYKALLKQMRLSTVQFLNKQSVTSDIFMYQLTKYPSDSATALQSYFFPNLTDAMEKIEFIDSQVKYGKRYDYSLFCHSMSIKQTVDLNLTRQQWLNMIDYLFTKIPHLDRILATVTANRITLENTLLRDCVFEIIEKLKSDGQDPFVYSPIFYRKMLFSDSMTSRDHPPPPPEVNIDGFIGIDNKLSILLNGSISEFKAQPIMIQPEDEGVFIDSALSQKLTNLTQPMLFDGDDRIQKFQIFRLDFHPTSYSDFLDKYKEISTTVEQQICDIQSAACSDIKANHANYIDEIQPNKKYYYMFRSVDVHGNISNPSQIYEVEIINSEGTIFPFVKNVDLFYRDDKKSKYEAKRFIHIEPTVAQKSVNETLSGYFEENGPVKQTADLVKDNIVLGLTENNIWNKTYRLKIRSKLTGKIVEVDFKFTHIPEQQRYFYR
jgi:hypothetical protein